MKKNKGELVDNLYINKKDSKNKKTKVSNAKKQKNKKNDNKNTQNSKINLNNEIIIGLTPKSKPTKEVTKKTKKSKKINNSNVKKKKVNNKKKSIKLKIIKWISLFIVIVTSIVLFMLSSVFNIREITVSNNNKVSAQEIISLSELNTEENMFKISNSKIKENIKRNPYIETVKIKKKLSGQINLEVTERVPTFMLKFANAFVYINNQGYMLEISDVPLEIPIIIEFKTSSENIKAGDRLQLEDLKKLGDIIKIMKSAKSNFMDNLITEIDIKDSNNYKLKIEQEGKTVQFGDATDINTKLLKIKTILEEQKGVEGEIYFQDKEKTIFKSKV